MSRRLLPFVLLCVALPSLFGAGAQAPSADALRVERVRSDGALVLERHGLVRLQGVEVPKAPVPARLRRALEALVGRAFEVQLDAGDETQLAAAVLTAPGATQSVNAALLRQGVSFYRARTQTVRAEFALRSASAEARAAGRGVWADVLRVRGAPPRQAGAVLGLYAEDERFDYHEQLRRVQAVGAQWVTLLFTAFVERVDAVAIDRRSSRTVTDARLRATIAHARSLGLRVALLPIVLVRHAEADDWRGTLRPRDPGRFWLAYDEFLCHYLDIARAAGVELVYVGSEYCSLEGQHAAWARVIANARGRYAGWLGYSANWDHYDVARFWPLLDQVGVTAYFELTDDPEAGDAALVAAWRRVRAELARLSESLGRPLVLTELGYPSQDGCNTAPWNYYLARDRVDLAEQAACFRAFAEVMHDAPFLRGVHFFDFFERGGPEDTTYAIWGKPAQEEVERFLRAFAPGDVGEDK